VTTVRVLSVRREETEVLPAAMTTNIYKGGDSDMAALTDEQMRFLSGRKYQLRYARLGTLVAILYIVGLLACAWLNPLWFNPMAVGQLAESGVANFRTLAGMAESLPVVLALFWFAALVAILYWEAIAGRDKRYLEIIEALQQQNEPSEEQA